MIKQRRTHYMAIWLGLFAMLMIHVGPLISGTQALVLSHHSASLESDSVVVEHHQHATMLVDEMIGADTHADAVDYHALMGHHSAPSGAPEWLTNLEMCGYCDLLTVSPPLVLVVLLALPVRPQVQWLAVLPTPPMPLPAAHSLRHPRAPPVHLFA